MQTIIGLFSRKEEAQKAVQTLQHEGVSPADIRMVDQEQGDLQLEVTGQAVEQETTRRSGSRGWLWGMLIGLLLGALIGLLFGMGILPLPAFLAFMPADLLLSVLAWALIGAVVGALLGVLFGVGEDEDASRAVRERMRQRTLVSVRADDTQVNRVMRIMRSLNPLSIEHTSGDWFSSNRPGFDLQSGPSAVPVTGQRASIAAVQEELHITRREVPGKRTRVSTYVETEPAEKEVELRQERIELERQRAERDITDEDLLKFQPFVESSFEITEIVEVPYARKQAAVMEEVRVSKTVEHRQEKIHETLRRQDVKVEQISAVAWQDYENSFRQHYEKTYQAHRGPEGSFQEYLPAYHFGFDLAQEPAYKGKSWNALEPIAHQQWQKRGSQSAWDDVKQAVRYAWETVVQTTR